MIDEHKKSSGKTNLILFSKAYEKIIIFNNLAALFKTWGKINEKLNLCDNLCLKNDGKNL
jgi:hypothetical protein